MAQSGSALAWGARGRGFKSAVPTIIFYKASELLDLEAFLLFLFIECEVPYPYYNIRS